MYSKPSFQNVNRLTLKPCVCVRGSGGDDSCSSCDPARSPVGCKSPLRTGAHHPALQRAATSLWCPHHCRTHQARLAHSSTRPAAPPWRGKMLKDTNKHTYVHMNNQEIIHYCVIFFVFPFLLWILLLYQVSSIFYASSSRNTKY